MRRSPAFRRGGSAALGLLLATVLVSGGLAQAPLSTPDQDEAPINLPQDRSEGGTPLSLDASDAEDWTGDPGEGDDAAQIDEASDAAPDGTTDRGPADLEADPVAPIRLGILPRRDLRRTLEAVSGLQSRLSDTLGRPVEFVPVSSYAAMIDAQVLGRIDGGFYSTSAFARAESLCKCLEPIVTPAAADGTTAFYALIVAPQAAKLSRVTDLDGAVAATARPDSVGGTRAQLASLLADGVDIDALFAELLGTPSPEAAVEAMLAGEADVAFAWSSLSGPASVGYSRGTLAYLSQSGAVDPASLKILWRSPPIAHGPVALAAKLPAGDRAAVAAVLIGLKEDYPDAYGALEPYYSGGYEASEAEDYRGASTLATEKVEEALAGLRREAGQAPAGEDADGGEPAGGEQDAEGDDNSEAGDEAEPR